MSKIVFPPAIDLADLILVLAGADFTGPKLHLYSNDLTPTRATILADLTEVVASGVVAQTITYAAPFLDVNGIAVVSGGELQYTMSGATPDVCYGVYLTNTAGSKLLWSARLDDAPFSFVETGNTLALVFKQSLNNGLLDISVEP